MNGRDAQDTQRTRTTKREARWYLKDGSAVRLPVIGGAAAAHLELELAGAVWPTAGRHPSSADSTLNQVLQAHAG